MGLTAAPAEPTPELLSAVEQRLDEIAADVHEAWADTKRAAGWRHGPLDREAGTHPDLVPYAELSAAQQEYDRATVWATVQGLVRTGFVILPPS